MLDVDFEWFDPQPEVDFHGLKTLCRQLFDIDAQLFDLSELVELILSQPLLGSTVKVDGNETDPYAFLTVLNMHVHRVCLLDSCWKMCSHKSRRRNPSLKLSQAIYYGAYLALSPLYLLSLLPILLRKSASSSPNDY